MGSLEGRALSRGALGRARERVVDEVLGRAGGIAVEVLAGELGAELEGGLRDEQADGLVELLVVEALASAKGFEVEEELVEVDGGRVELDPGADGTVAARAEGGGCMGGDHHELLFVFFVVLRSAGRRGGRGSVPWRPRQRRNALRLRPSA